MAYHLPTRSRLHWLDRIVTAGVIAAVIAMLLGELGRFYWLFELGSHFLVQYLFGFAITAAYFLLRRRWRWFVVAAMLSIVPAWRLATYASFEANAATAATGSHRLRIMTINVHASSDRYDLVRAEIERLDPDIVFLPENTDRWAAGLAPLRARYPYVVDGQSPSVFSLFLFSRIPLSDAAIIKLPEPDGFPAIVARICPGATSGERDLPADRRHSPAAAARRPDRGGALRRLAGPARSDRGTGRRADGPAWRLQLHAMVAAVPRSAGGDGVAG